MGDFGDDVSLSAFHSDPTNNETFEKEVNYESPENDSPEYANIPAQTTMPQMNQIPVYTEAQKQEKNRILARLHRMSMTQKGFPIQFSVDDSLDSLRKKNTLATHTGKSKVCLEMMKRGTIFAAKGAEALSTKFPNRYVDLEGYSDHLYLQISEFDNLLYDVYDSYSEELSEVSPVVTYLFAIGSNAMMYSMSRKMLGINKTITQQKQPRMVPQYPPRQYAHPSEDMTPCESSDDEDIEDDDSPLESKRVSNPDTNTVAETNNVSDDASASSEENDNATTVTFETYKEEKKQKKQRTRGRRRSRSPRDSTPPEKKTKFDV